MFSWPDGTLKWSGHALPANIGTNTQSFTVHPGTPAEPTSPVSVTHDGDAITVSTGSFSGDHLLFRIRAPCSWSFDSAAHFNAPGSTTLLSSITLNGKSLAQNASLVLHVQNAPDPDLTLVQDGTTQLPQVQRMIGKTDTVQVEQQGPVRAVIKVGQPHKNPANWSQRGNR